MLKTLTAAAMVGALMTGPALAKSAVHIGPWTVVNDGGGEYGNWMTFLDDLDDRIRVYCGSTPAHYTLAVDSTVDEEQTESETVPPAQGQVYDPDKEVHVQVSRVIKIDGKPLTLKSGIFEGSLTYALSKDDLASVSAAQKVEILPGRTIVLGHTAEALKALAGYCE
jgi:hypothetical protein